MADPFAGVAGHARALDQLRSQIDTGRLAHAYLFVGDEAKTNPDGSAAVMGELLSAAGKKKGKADTAMAAQQLAKLEAQEKIYAARRPKELIKSTMPVPLPKDRCGPGWRSRPGRAG